MEREDEWEESSGGTEFEVVEDSEQEELHEVVQKGMRKRSNSLDGLDVSKLPAEVFERQQKVENGPLA